MMSTISYAAPHRYSRLNGFVPASTGKKGQRKNTIEFEEENREKKTKIGNGETWQPKLIAAASGCQCVFQFSIYPSLH